MTRAPPGSFPQPEKKMVRIRSMKHRNLSDLGNNISGGALCSPIYFFIQNSWEQSCSPAYFIHNNWEQSCSTACLKVARVGKGNRVVHPLVVGYRIVHQLESGNMYVWPFVEGNIIIRLLVEWNIIVSLLVPGLTVFCPLSLFVR